MRFPVILSMVVSLTLISATLFADEAPDPTPVELLNTAGLWMEQGNGPGTL